jgi:hypothetical protein
LGGLSDVRWHPDQRAVLAISAGALWHVDPQSRSAREIAPAIQAVWDIDGKGDLLFDNQGLELFRLGPSGIVWRSRRLSWDGFQGIRLEDEKVVGEAWSPIEDRWIPFSVDLATGRTEGGSYNGPEMSLDVR